MSVMMNIVYEVRFYLVVFLLLFSGCQQAAPSPVVPDADQTRHDTILEAATTDIFPLGDLMIRSGEIIVSDPGYEAPKSTDDNGINGIIRHVKTGTWKAFVGRVDARDWGIRCSELIVHHADYQSMNSSKWTSTSFEVGVDSGQAGIFDSDSFGKDTTIPKDFFEQEPPLVPESLWYSMCCRETLSELGAGVIPGGAVSSSGFGDGGYVCQYQKANDDTVVAVRIVFITKDELD